MVAILHGKPGHSLDTEMGGKDFGQLGRRGAYYERVVASALAKWLSARAETFHIFHDLVNLTNVEGAGLKPISLGKTNIDHIVLSGSGWLIVDSKGCGAGSLRTDERGKGMLVSPDGKTHPQPWMNGGGSYPKAGVPFRLTEGQRGLPVWVVPDATDYSHPSVARAGFLERGGFLLSVAELQDGALDTSPPDERPAAIKPGVPEADPETVARFREHLSVQSPPTLIAAD